MLINITHDTAREHRKLLLCGVLFLAMIATFIGVSIAAYQKVFEPVTMVTIKADRAGMQLAKFGDVRINGVLVGQVRSVEQDGEQASIKVGLRPDAAKEIPGNVTVQILPTTLFGQKFVSLVRPDRPRGQLKDGQVIPADRVTTNVELNRILAELFPLLRSIRPADLSRALTALANALEGKGDTLGITMDKARAYLREIEGELPQLRRDMVLLADVAETYADAAPDLLDTLGNLTVTANTVVDQKDTLEALMVDLSGLAVTSTRVLEANERNLIRATELTEPLTDLLAVYSPQYPCLFQGMAKYDDYLNDMFSGQRVKQYAELVPTQREGFKEEDRPVYGEIGRGPRCHGLPTQPTELPPYDINNGDNGSIDKTNPLNWLSGAAFARTSNQYAGTEAEQYAVNAILAARSGRPIDEYGALSAIVYAPLVKGEEVTEG